MITHRNTSYHPRDINNEEAIQAILALFSAKQTTNVARWICEECGMIHMGSRPLACDSCGHKHLTQQADLHWEMNARW